jgi:predicted transposase YbfD/YdcC
VDLNNVDYIRETLDLPDCQIALRVDRELRDDRGEIVLHDTRYYVSSLDPDQVTAADLLRHIRQHWRIENSLHFLKDRWWDEDLHHTRRPHIGSICNYVPSYWPPKWCTPLQNGQMFLRIAHGMQGLSGSHVIIGQR